MPPVSRDRCSPDKHHTCNVYECIVSMIQGLWCEAYESNLHFFLSLPNKYVNICCYTWVTIRILLYRINKSQRAALAQSLTCWAVHWLAPVSGSHCSQTSQAMDAPSSAHRPILVTFISWAWNERTWCVGLPRDYRHANMRSFIRSHNRSALAAAMAGSAGDVGGGGGGHCMRGWGAEGPLMVPNVALWF